MADSITAREARGAIEEPECEHDAAAMKACLASLPMEVREYVDRTQRVMRDVQEAREHRLQQEQQEEEDRTRANDTTATVEGQAEAGAQSDAAEGQLAESKREGGQRGRREGGRGRGRGGQRKEGERAGRGGETGVAVGGDRREGDKGRGGDRKSVV